MIGLIGYVPLQTLSFSENFEMEKGQITLAGFLKLHEMALEDTEGGEEEIRDTLSSMGYNSALQLVKVNSKFSS